jgi:hypothetical protein
MVINTSFHTLSVYLPHETAMLFHGPSLTLVTMNLGTTTTPNSGQPIIPGPRIAGKLGELHIRGVQTW